MSGTLTRLGFTHEPTVTWRRCRSSCFVWPMSAAKASTFGRPRSVSQRLDELVLALHHHPHATRRAAPSAMPAAACDRWQKSRADGRPNLWRRRHRAVSGGRSSSSRFRRVPQRRRSGGMPAGSTDDVHQLVGRDIGTASSGIAPVGPGRVRCEHGWVPFRARRVPLTPSWQPSRDAMSGVTASLRTSPGQLRRAARHGRIQRCWCLRPRCWPDSERWWWE